MSKANLGDFTDIDTCFEQLKEYTNFLYNNTNNMQKFMFCVGRGLVSYAYFCKQDNAGVLLHIVSTSSGTGKTTICKVLMEMYINQSVVTLSGRKSITDLGLDDLRVKLNSLPVFWDELTKVSKDKVENFVFSSTKKTTRRTKIDVPVLTRNRNFFISTANVAITDLLAEEVMSKEALYRRIIEIDVPAKDKTHCTFEKEETREKLGMHYGVIGQKVLEYVLNNFEAQKKMYGTEELFLYKLLNVGSDFRFIVNIFACALVGNFIANEFKLLQYSREEILSFIKYTFDDNVSKILTLSSEENALNKFKEILAFNQDRVFDKNNQLNSSLASYRNGVKILIADDCYCFIGAFVKQYFINSKESHLSYVDVLEESKMLKINTVRFPQANTRKTISLRCYVIHRKYIENEFEAEK